MFHLNNSLHYLNNLFKKSCTVGTSFFHSIQTLSEHVSKKDANEVLSATLETIKKAIKKGDKVTLVGFGTFERRERAARKGRNPQTGKEIKITAKKVPAFSAGKKFKELVK